eukprot:scaffold5438_cov237-Pinguiococcus_pyrenoidosus.AAC.5
MTYERRSPAFQGAIVVQLAACQFPTLSVLLVSAYLDKHEMLLAYRHGQRRKGGAKSAIQLLIQRLAAAQAELGCRPGADCAAKNFPEVRQMLCSFEAASNIDLRVVLNLHSTNERPTFDFVARIHQDSEAASSDTPA